MTPARNISSISLKPVLSVFVLLLGVVFLANMTCPSYQNFKTSSYYELVEILEAESPEKEKEETSESEIDDFTPFRLGYVLLSDPEAEVSMPYISFWFDPYEEIPSPPPRRLHTRPC